MNDENYFEGIISGSELNSVYKNRKTPYIFKTVLLENEAPYLEEGWAIDRRNKKSLRLAKLKSIDQIFENEIWCLLYKMGYKHLNSDTNFRIGSPSENKNDGKQFDIFAKDDETVLIVDCETSAKPSSRDLQKDMAEIVAIREDIRVKIYKHYGKKLKLRWIFATRNIIWNVPDFEMANKYNISVLREQDVQYFSELVKHLGSSAKYQLLADIFKDQDISGLDLEIPAIKGRMGDNSFYSFAIEPSKLLKIAYVCHRLKGNDEKTLITYQRMLEKKDLKRFKNSLKMEAYFQIVLL